MTYRKQQFTDEPVELDANDFDSCTFTRCHLIYRGSIQPSLSRCTFDGCLWEFDDAAARTVSFLKGLYHGMGEAGRRLVNDTLNRRPEDDDGSVA